MNDTTKSKSRWYRPRLKALLAVGIALALLLGSAVWLLSPEPVWQYTGQFHAVIDRANRVVVRDGGHCSAPDDADGYPVLFEIRDVVQTNELRRQLVFQQDQYGLACGCSGYPVIDWYDGDTRIAHTSLHHGEAIRWTRIAQPDQPIRWDGFQNDGVLTDESSEWVVQWLVHNGVPIAQLK